MGVKIESLGDKLAIFEIKFMADATLKELIPSIDKIQRIYEALKTESYFACTNYFIGCLCR
jgi:hypothetical protein